MDLPPLVILLTEIFVLAHLGDFFLGLYSIRMSQATGRFQIALWNQVGQNFITDVVMGSLFQFVSFHKKGFFKQFSSLINVGSFTKKQVYGLLIGTFLGIGASALLLFPFSLPLSLGFAFMAFGLNLLTKDQVRDFFMALFNLSLFISLVFLLDKPMTESLLTLAPIGGGDIWTLLVVLLTTLFFRTPLAFLLGFSLAQYYFKLPLTSFPLFFFVHSGSSLLVYYWQSFQKRKRLTGALLSTAFLQILQGILTTWFMIFFKDSFPLSFQIESFRESFQMVLLFYSFYHFFSLFVNLPLLYGLTWIPLFNKASDQKSQSQKILNLDQGSQYFSIHLSLLLLRQEFKKYTTSIHTIFKLSRESDFPEKVIRQKFIHYQKMLIRVGDELKELCFSIGKQRSYSWHVKENMDHYRLINQLELLVDDLGLVTEALCQPKANENWKKECRSWLRLQLKLFESFFNQTLGVGKEDPLKVKDYMDKSYEILDRSFVDKKALEGLNISSQTFYRITESIGGLA